MFLLRVRISIFKTIEMCIRDRSKAAAEELGLKEGTPISYGAVDQPNNAVSLNVFNPAEIASSVGPSGVV